MRRPSALLLCICTVLALSACTSDEAGKQPAESSTSSVATTGGDAPILKIPILPGYKYYVGGPRMGQDEYGRFRVKSFLGEVEQPPSRGMIFGAKAEGDALEYRMWGNGLLLNVQRGKMKNGVFWPDQVEAYRLGKLIVRQNVTYEDDAKRYKVTAQDIDPENGEVIRTTESSHSYYPPAPKEEEEALGADEDSGEDSGDKAPAAAAPAAPKAE